MKIFNWVHRRFQHKDVLGEEEKKAELTATADPVAKALLQNVVVSDDWRDGILTIGTLGFDPFFQGFNFQENLPKIQEEQDEEYSVSTDNDDPDNGEISEEDEELNPLILFTEFDRDRKIDSDRENDTKEKDKKKKTGERITLADLFSADSSDNDIDIVEKEQRNKNDGPVKVTKNRGDNNNNSKVDGQQKTKGHMSFAKKLVPRVAQDSRPIHKLHQLMTRMLKRKIHPDVDGKFHKMDSNMKQRVSDDEIGVCDLVRLLPIQDAVM